ncbi:MAG TPA: flagellar biosynthesis anti-sigma factor FlgM [Granulicella sp.]|nr:flagellar biosynthesis anti-sigma factor FlgM [Granulicella sp.]
MNITNDVNQVRIADNSTSSPATAATGAASRSSAAGAGGAAANAAAQFGDQTTISSTSDALSAALNASDVRTGKVASLQAAIQGGAYNVPSGAVADKLLSSMLQ